MEVRIGRVPGDERARCAELVLGLAAVHVSVSHGCGGVAAAASAHFPVGADVGAVRRIPLGNPARRRLRAAEAEWVERREPEDRIVAFLWPWTRKEALGKAVGLGLAGGTGLSRAVSPPGSRPPSGRALMAPPGGAALGAARLGAVPGSPGPAVAAGFADGLVFAAAARGAGAAGAVVRVGPGVVDGARERRDGDRGQVADTA